MDEGPTRRPRAKRWPLDGLLNGVGSLRVLRELYRSQRRSPDSTVRAWDVWVWTGVTPQGAAKALERFRRAGLVEALPPSRSGGAREYRLSPAHPCYRPFARLFEAERACVPRYAVRRLGPAPH